MALTKYVNKKMVEWHRAWSIGHGAWSKSRKSEIGNCIEPGARANPQDARYQQNRARIILPRPVYVIKVLACLIAEFSAQPEKTCKSGGKEQERSRQRNRI